MSGREVRVLAQAKVNLYLRILAREASGYHQIETIFLRLALADEVVVRTGVPGRTLDCRGADVGPMERNLAWRAAMAFRDAGGPDTFAIEIEKKIPVGSGLGGGSADAAAVMRALNVLSDRPLPDDQLLALAATLGADVPFLASPAVMALAWGQGERMLALDPPPSRPVVLLVPSFGISTADAYAWFDTHRAIPAPAPRLWQAGHFSGWPKLAALAHNDFEDVVAARHSEVGELVRVLRALGASPAIMSGSGSSVFGVFDDSKPDLTSIRCSARVILSRTLPHSTGPGKVVVSD
ncbi:MAG TPA: 4-(cytidine 5'-diphospho)-2-C-methyl-D-erythritol kinase [Gemmatimonadaceae bacterium]|nr:4-(cytidine 5'-diphospho)-2-C-methyl-D-erythritol kinase [Gemmatimonadaceae bacterium]